MTKAARIAPGVIKRGTGPSSISSMIGNSTDSLPPFTSAISQNFPEFHGIFPLISHNFHGISMAFPSHFPIEIFRPRWRWRKRPRCRR
jgi:hypothetical protein